jgi:hypothetical protein
VRSEFPGYYRPIAEEFDKMWRTGTFVVDANVLLNVYRFSERARDDLLKVLHRVADRLWIPHQVALEYQAHRVNVIAGEKVPDTNGTRIFLSRL